MESEQDARTGDQGAERYRFGNVVVDALAHTIHRDRQPVAVEPKAFAVLLVLLRHAGQMVPRDELLDQVWGHRHVTPGVLTRAIAQLRSALDDRTEPHYIQTQHALGYRFIAPLEIEPVAGNDIVETRAPFNESAVEEEGLSQPPADTMPPVAQAGVYRHAVLYAGDERRKTHSGWSLLGGAFCIALILAAVHYRRQSDQLTTVVDPSIAVLPFITLSDERQDRYFAEGLAAEMLNALAGEPGLTVAAWQPSEAIDRSLGIKSLGEKLGVATILDASVRRDGKRLRIDARLSDTKSGTTLWSRSFDGDTNAVFDTQSQIAREVVKALLGVLPDDGAGLDRRLAPTRNAAAFDAYLLGLYQLLGPNSGGSNEAAESFRRALVHDVDFARAQAGLCRAELSGFEGSRDVKALERARLACLRAENMDKSVGEVALALGDLYRVTGGLERASMYYMRAQQDRASRAAALVGLAQIDVQRKLPEQAMEKFGQALNASPGDAHVYAEMGYQQHVLGREQEALLSFRKAVDLRPGSAEYWMLYGSLLQLTGDEAGSAAALQRSLAIEPSEYALSNLGTFEYRRGDYAAATALYRRAIELGPSNFFLKGYLGDALLADPATAGQAANVFAKAAGQAEEYLRVKPDAAPSIAAMGWYLANTGDSARALDMVARSEDIDAHHVEVAITNAQTLAVLGKEEDARKRIQVARAQGIAEARITTNVVFRRHGLGLAGEDESGSRH